MDGTCGPETGSRKSTLNAGGSQWFLVGDLLWSPRASCLTRSARTVDSKADGVPLTFTWQASGTKDQKG
jgi:hypothetical protein